MTRSRARGFTLIEVMVVVAIVGVLAAFGVPAVKDYLGTGAVRTAASDFYIALLQARSEAIKSRSDAVVAPIGATWKTGWTVKVGGNLYQQTDAIRSDLDVVMLLPDGSVTTTVTSITYSSNGRVNSTTGGAQTVVFYAPALTTVIPRCVSIDTNGVPRVRTDTDKVATNGCI